jgi:sec-independent protein translocase protein TatB
MFDIGWSEFVLIAVVALIAIGPKELPGVLRTIGQWMGKARKMAAEFQGQFQEAMREAEMADLKDSFDEVRKAASGFSAGNLISSLEKNVSSSLRIDNVDKPAVPPNTEAVETEATATPAIEPPVTPSEPEAPAPQTFVEAETHTAIEPPAVVTENRPAVVAEETTPATDSPKDAKAS